MQKQKFTAAHLDKLKIDIGKKKDVEATKMRVTEIKEKLQRKKFLFSEIKARSEKEEEKLAEVSKLLDVAMRKERRGEEAVRE